MKKYKSKFEEGNFNKGDFSKVLHRPIVDLYTAFTEVESTSNHYLKKSG